MFRSSLFECPAISHDIQRFSFQQIITHHLCTSVGLHPAPTTFPLIFNRTKLAHDVLYFYLCILSFWSIFNQTEILKMSSVCLVVCVMLFLCIFSLIACCWMDPLSSLHSVHCKIVLSAYFFVLFAGIRYIRYLYCRQYKVAQNDLSQHTKYSHYNKHFYLLHLGRWDVFEEFILWGSCKIRHILLSYS